MAIILKVTNPKISVSFFLIYIVLFSVNSFSQEKVLLTEKPGAFKLEKLALNSQAPDLYGKPCACTKTESDATLVKLENLV